MVHRCCISSCKMNSRVAEAKGLSYHCFPLKDPHREKWIQAILPHVDKPENFKVVQGYTRICSRHFRTKEYSIDSKKRARLNSNAVPTVFPRKSVPIVIQSPIETRKSRNYQLYLSSSASDATTVESTRSYTPTSTPMSPLSSNEDLLRPVYAETLCEQPSSDQLTYNIYSSSQSDHCSAANSVAGSQSDDPHSDDSGSETEEQSQRKRRKWNRNAFSRGSKSKQKKSISPDSVSTTLDADGPLDVDGLPTSFLDEFNLQSLQLGRDSVNPGEITLGPADYPNISDLQLALDNDINHSATSFSCLSMNDDIPADVLNLIEEQELLQSIQAVTLDCADGDLSLNLNMQNVHLNSDDVVSGSSQDDVDLSPYVAKPEVTKGSCTLNDPAAPPVDSSNLPTSDLENLSIHRKASLRNASGNSSSSVSSTPEKKASYCDSIIAPISHSLDLFLSDTYLSKKLGLFLSETSLTKELSLEDSDSESKRETDCRKPEDGRKRNAKAAQRKSSPLKSKLVGVSKKSKNSDKCYGKFSVERFQDSDKDIEYYTSFPSFTLYESFFNSLETYVSKLKVSAAMFGVPELILDDFATQSKSQEGPPPQEEQKTRSPATNRAIARIDELFMTLIRLKRRLPEKVLGHMFFVSQSTVSRTVRAWTTLLSKLLEPKPIPSDRISPEVLAADNPLLTKGSKCSSEYNFFTSRGIYVPESFRQLFTSDLASTIISPAQASRFNPPATFPPLLATVSKPKRPPSPIAAAVTVPRSASPILSKPATTSQCKCARRNSFCQCNSSSSLTSMLNPNAKSDTHTSTPCLKSSLE